MSLVWHDNAPIYRQIQQNVVSQILDGTLKPLDPLLSVRQMAISCGVNPLTVTHAYHELVKEGVVIKKRGVGMFVSKDAFTILTKEEKRKFLEEEWPKVVERIKYLNLDIKELFKSN